MSKVAALKTTSETILEDISKLMHLAEFEKFLPKDIPIILKDNITWHKPFLGCNTTPWQLEGVIKTLRDYGYRDVYAVHNDTLVTDGERGVVQNKLRPIYRHYGIHEAHLKDLKWVDIQPITKMRVLDKIFYGGIKVPKFFIGKSIIQLPTLKVHAFTGITGAIKNSFGGLIGNKRHYTHTWIHETLIDLLSIQKEIHPGMFAVMDGTIAGLGAGPRTLQPTEKNVILASGNQAALDSVAAWMLGFSPWGIPFLEMMRDEWADIEMVGGGFEKGKWIRKKNNFATMIGKWLWFGRLKRFQWLLFHTPLVHVFALMSSIYHDHFWWPLRGRRIRNKIRKHTQWGKLFEEYES